MPITVSNPDRDYRSDPKIQKLLKDFLNRGRSIIGMFSVLKEMEDKCDEIVMEKTDTISVFWVMEKLKEAREKQENMGAVAICFCGNMMDKIEGGWECRNHDTQI